MYVICETFNVLYGGVNQRDQDSGQSRLKAIVTETETVAVLMNLWYFWQGELRWAVHVACWTCSSTWLVVYFCNSCPQFKMVSTQLEAEGGSGSQASLDLITWWHYGICCTPFQATGTFQAAVYKYHSSNICLDTPMLHSTFSTTLKINNTTCNTRT